MKRYISIDFDLNWSSALDCISDKVVYLLNKSSTDFILAWDCDDEIRIPFGAYNHEVTQDFIDRYHGHYIFGYLSYDIKNDETRNLTKQAKGKSVDDLVLNVAKHVIVAKGSSRLYFGTATEADVRDMLRPRMSENSHKSASESLTLEPQVNKASYLQNIVDIKAEIQNGTIYEINYCMNFEQNYASFNPTQTYRKLSTNTEAPFSCFVSNSETTIMCASPERFICRNDQVLFSQPIKGTAKRGKDKREDESIKEQLISDQKEIAENVMIVDLVRNDLSKIAKKNSVSVDELCKLYSFNTVHQLISKISCTPKEGTNFTTILQALFPMGSMTGAPKISAIKHIDQFESFNRGIYSGAIGYIEPNGNFDFNVVIRSIIEKTVEKRITCSVGGAITIKSNPENEYEECLLKLDAIRKTLC